MVNSLRVLRGGSWFVISRLCRSANRIKYGPRDRGNSRGFRVVRVSRTLSSRGREEDKACSE